MYDNVSADSTKSQEAKITINNNKTDLSFLLHERSAERRQTDNPQYQCKLNFSSIFQV